MRKCSRCGGRGSTPDAMRKVWCDDCGNFWFASKEEVGEKPRSLKSTHKAITGATRKTVLFRAGGKCELCGRCGALQVGHLVSVQAGYKYGLTDDEINHPENLCAMCEECNSNVRADVVPLRVALVMIRDRIQTEMRTNGLQPSPRRVEEPKTMDAVAGQEWHEDADSMHRQSGEVE